MRAVLSAIACLLFRSRPMAIAFVVIAMIVFAFKTVMRRWFRPHVGKERLETIEPSLANLDPAPAPVLKMVIVGIQTSLLHRMVSVVFGSSPSTMTQIPFAVFATRLALATTARGRPTKSEF
jgi:hypothetical protein